MFSLRIIYSHRQLQVSQSLIEKATIQMIKKTMKTRIRKILSCQMDKINALLTKYFII